MIKQRATKQRGSNHSDHLTTETTDDQARLNVMTDEQSHQAPTSDPDVVPMTKEQLHNAPRLFPVRDLRRALEMTQEEFAQYYGIPLGTLRDWEQGRVIPDQATRSYLLVIARDPETVYRLLNDKS